MQQLLFHFIGDYILQNNWMASNKTKMSTEGHLACIVHCLLYAIPFAFIASPAALIVIFLTHFFIDKYRLAAYVCSLKNGRWFNTSNNGAPSETPAFISVWVMIIVDNIIHVTINYAAIHYL